MRGGWVGGYYVGTGACMKGLGDDQKRLILFDAYVCVCVVGDLIGESAATGDQWVGGGGGACMHGVWRAIGYNMPCGSFICYAGG
jgi:hypothetical protein